MDIATWSAVTNDVVGAAERLINLNFVTIIDIKYLHTYVNI